MRTRVTVTDPVDPALFREWVRIDAGQDTVTFDMLVKSSIDEVESTCRKPLYASSWKEEIGPVSSVPTYFSIGDVFSEPQNVVVTVIVSSTPTPQPVDLSYWDTSKDALVIKIESPLEIDEDSTIEVTWDDQGVPSLDSVTNARGILIAKHYDGNVDDVSRTVETLLQQHMRV